MRTRQAPPALSHGGSIAAGLAALLLAAPSLGQTPPEAPPAAPAPAAKPAAPPRPAAPRKAAEPAEAPLPEPEVRASVITPSALGPWVLRITNEGSRWVRIPADARLLRISIEDGDTMSKKHKKPLSCALPGALKPDGFPERDALMLGPGETYLEPFDPRLFCFGKAAAAIEGGAVVHARYGWEPSKRPAPKKKGQAAEGPFAVQGTEYPPAVMALRELAVPTMVLPYARMEHDELDEQLSELAKPDPAKGGEGDKGDKPADEAKGNDAAKGDKDAKPSELAKDKNGDAGKDKDKGDKPAEGPKPPIDELAPRLEVTTTPFVDTANRGRVVVTIKATNVGHRPLLAVIRPRMLAFRVEGPLVEGRGAAPEVSQCFAMPPTDAFPREAFRPLKPNASVTMTLIVPEICKEDLFRRPGLYKLTPTLHLNEDGARHNLAAFTAVVPASAPTLVRVQSAPDPFHTKPPRALKPKPAGE